MKVSIAVNSFSNRIITIKILAIDLFIEISREKKSLEMFYFI